MVFLVYKNEPCTNNLADRIPIQTMNTCRAIIEILVCLDGENEII